MNRRTFLLSASAAATGPVLTRVSAAQTSMSESAGRIERAAAAGMALQRRDWEQGIFAQAMLEAERRDDLIRLTRAAIVQRTPDGRMAVVVSGGPADPAMGGEAYARAAAWTGDQALQQAVDSLLDWILHRAPRSADGTLYHVFGKPEMWSDGLNAAPPFLAAMGHFDDALAQIEGYRKRLWNPEKKLFAHIWDDGRQQLTDPGFWGGGNGWAAAGLARTIRQLPPLARHLDRLRLAGYVRELLDGCLVHQRPDGLFHNIVDQPSTFVETNLAQMLAFTIYTGLAGGWLPAQYRAAADKMRQAAYSKMDAEGFVQGVCGAPNFDRSGLSTEGQAFLIMMEAAAQRAN